MSTYDVIVVGAGVLGLCTAAELAARGHAVTVIDPGGTNASSVAAGMLSPALESLTEGLEADQAALLGRARDLWPEFADRHGLKLDRSGATWIGPDAKGTALRLLELGFDAVVQGDAVQCPDDWRVDPTASLSLLARRPGVTRISGQVDRVTAEPRHWRMAAGDGRVWFAPTVVLATGAAPALVGLPPEVAALVSLITPVRGQITTVAAIPPDRIVRGPGAYVVAQDGGVLIGASMEPGRRDLGPDAEESAARVAAGLALLGREGKPATIRVGIRGSTPDGLPMAGATNAPGLHLALAPRRNGWLLGPLVAHTVADGIEGITAAPDALALAPHRFDGLVDRRIEPQGHDHA